MKDSIEFDDEVKKESTSNWQMGMTSTGSFGTEESRVGIQQQNLQILHQKEISSQRTLIPATFHEKLTFYRAFVTSPSKTNIVSVQQIHFNWFLWCYIFNVFCKSLPSTYVYIFLSIYAPDNHYFIPKMIPLCYGCVWSSISCAFFGLLNHLETLILLWYYVVYGIMDKNPWNRCSEHILDDSNSTLLCYEVGEFTQLVRNKTPTFHDFGYKIDNSSDDLIQLAQNIYLLRSWSHIQSPYFFSTATVVLTVVAAIFHKQVFKKYIWKILNFSQLALNFVFLATFAHMSVYYFSEGFDKVEVSVSESAHELWNADIDILAESMVGPPIVHVLTARGTQKVTPSRHSTAIITSNAVYYIFRGLLSYMLKRYCENVVGAPVKISNLNPLTYYFLWPIYFSYFYLGDFYSIAFYLLNTITETLVMVITFSCLVETITYEWPWMKRWLITLFICVVTGVAAFTLSMHSRIFLYIYTTGVATMAEAIAVFCFYPLGRLVDDITFHYGAPPTFLRILNLRIVPVYYAVKLYVMLSRLLSYVSHIHYENLCPFGVKFLYIQATPFLFGAVYIIYKIVYRKKEGWQQLFVPVPEWGPKDYTERQLRKQYDSRQYVGSQAPRDLSRYFIEKAELKTYKLDIPYDRYSRHSTTQSELRFEEEKKRV